MNRKLLVALLSGAIAMPMAAQGVEIEASGHLLRSLVFHDRDDDAIDPEHRGGGSSPSRFRLMGAEEMDSGLTVGVNLEYGSGQSAGDSPGIRHAAVSLGGEFGTVTLGQTGPATHIISHANFDNYAWLGGVEIGCDFCNTDGGMVFNFASSGQHHAYGASRRPIVKFDSPSLGAVNLSFSADGNDFWDAALKASGAAGNMGYMFNLGFTNYAESTGDATPASNVTVKGSDVMALLAKEKMTLAKHLEANNDAVLTGLSNGEAVEEDDLMDDDYYNKYTPKKDGKVTYETEAISLAVALEFGQGTHINAAWTSMEPDMGSSYEASHFGIGHNIDNTSVAATFSNSQFGGGGDSWAVGIGHALGQVELYASYKALEFDLASREDYGLFVIGSRVKFN